jgi:anti-sigma regulatory factor (Ser/Thr protein kinase)
MRQEKEAQGPASVSRGSKKELPCPLELTFPSSSEYLSLVRSTVRWFSAKCGFGEKDCARVVLAVVEATTNIIRHAYGGESARPITLRMTELPLGLQLEFSDQGQGVSTSQLVGKDPDRLEPGGLGLLMMKTCMDDFRYEALPAGGARLVLTKLRRPEEGLGKEKKEAVTEKGQPRQ